MAPEIFARMSTADGGLRGAAAAKEEVKYKKTVDVYSLSLIIYQLYGGGAGFFPQCRDSIQLVLAKSSGTRPLLSLELLPTMSLRSVVRRGVANDPKARPSLAEYRAAVTGMMPSGQNPSPNKGASQVAVNVNEELHEFSVTRQRTIPAKPRWDTRLTRPPDADSPARRL
jgi:serine/threonine protein kinase